MLIILNRCFGGFSLSEKAVLRYAELKGIKLYFKNDGPFKDYYTIPVEEYDKLRESKDAEGMNNGYFSPYDIERTDPFLIQVIEELGEEANGEYAELKIVNVPDDVHWELEEYDGLEKIREVSRTFY